MLLIVFFKAIMNPGELEKWAKKILKVVQIDGTVVRCCYKTMPIAEWNSWKWENNDNIETFFGFQLTQDLSCLIRIYETWLLHMNLKQWASKRKLSTIFDHFSDELKSKLNAAYLFLGNDGQVAVEDRDVAILLNDILESLISGSKFILQKENLGPEMVSKQCDFFHRSAELEDLPIMILDG